MKDHITKLSLSKNERLSQLIIELKQPTFNNIIPSFEKDNHLNENQTKALTKVKTSFLA